MWMKRWIVFPDTLKTLEEPKTNSKKEIPSLDEVILPSSFMESLLKCWNLPWHSALMS